MIFQNYATIDPQAYVILKILASLLDLIVLYFFLIKEEEGFIITLFNNLFMEHSTQQVELQIPESSRQISEDDDTKNQQQQLPRRSKNKHYGWWFRILLYIIFLLVGQSGATLLGRFYYDHGGNSKWMATFVQSAGFPILIPLFFIFKSSKKIASSSREKPSRSSLFLLYLFFGLMLAGDNLMYSYGLLYLPVSTYSLICASQLAFNCLFSLLLNAQKFTALILNSVVIVTISAALLAVHSESDTSTKLSVGKYAIGFVCTVAASATYALYLSLLEVAFKRVIKSETFDTILKMQVFPSFVATCACVVGLYASGEVRSLTGEMDSFHKGEISYLMTLVWTAVLWQVCCIGLLGLIFEVSSLFSNVISTLGLPALPVLAVIFFHDKMDGEKVIALLLAVWGFLSYVYQNYLDDSKAKSSKSQDNIEATIKDNSVH